MHKKNTEISKFISLILRHKPETIDIKLDENGWCNIDSLIQGMENSGTKINRELLEYIVRNDSKQRYSINFEKNLIRANQGHSIPVDIEFELKKPPEKLYHGTIEKFIPSIKNKGLLKAQRQYVHLSQDEETATIVGKRRGIPIILEIDSRKMDEDGFKFYISTNKVWLCEYVPNKYIKF